MTILERSPTDIDGVVSAPTVQSIGRLSILDKNTVRFDRQTAVSLGLPNATHLNRFFIQRSLFMALPAYNGEAFEVGVRPPMKESDATALQEFCEDRDILFDSRCELTEERGVFHGPPQA